MTESFFEQAVEAHRAGNAATAEPLYRQCLVDDPGDWNALYLLGTALLQLGRFDECIETLSRVTAERPDVPDAHNNLGVACKAADRWEDAVRAFQAALEADPQYDQALFNLGSLMADRGLHADAEKCFRHALDLNPTDGDTRRALAKSLDVQQKWLEAETCYRQLAAVEPTDVDVQVSLGYALSRQEKLVEAAKVYRQVLEVRPDYHQVHNNLSYIYERQGRVDDAVAAARRTVEIEPTCADGYNNLGVALRSQHALDDACDAFAKAASLKPGFALAEFNLATTHLLAGRLSQGWPGYERRLDVGPHPPPQFLQPRWNGGDLSGRRLLVWADQGFGDTLQFCRFLAEAKRRSQATIVLQCRTELHSLMLTVDGVDEVIADAPPVGPVVELVLPAGSTAGAANFDAQISLASLPGSFDVELPSIAADVPYLSTGANVRNELADSIASAGDAFKIGLVWQGNPQQARDVVRSCPLPVLLDLDRVEGVALFSLQTGVEALNQLAGLDPARRPIDLGSHLTDFAETSAVMQRLDLIVTVDTAAAHLAGALGLNVWTLLSHTPDWRWLLAGDTTRWYPTMRLFRQPAFGDWTAVVSAVCDALTR